MTEMTKTSDHRYLMVNPQPEFGSPECYEAPEGKVWICAACGKLSRDIYGYKAINRGWDESCAMNAVLVYEHTT